MAILTGAVGCTSVTETAQSAPAHRTIHATRAVAPPVLDGKLDDVCWRQAQPITGFLVMDSDRPADNPSTGHVSYDETHLYIGVRAAIPAGLKPKGEKRDHDVYLFSDDVFEIMIDPGRTQQDYYQLVTNAYGQTFDGKRTHRGSAFDKAWDGDWQSAAHIGDGYFSIEMAIPFHNMGITKATGSTWGLNICREAKVPGNEYSSIAEKGVFNHAHRFAAVTGLDVDFSKYLVPVGDAQAALVDGDMAMVSVPITNQTGKPRKVKVQIGQTTHELTLGADQTVDVPVGEVTAKPISPVRTDLYFIEDEPPARTVTVKDAATGTTLSSSVVTRPWFCEAMWIEVKDPWQRKTSSTKTKAVEMTIHTRIANRRGGTLTVTLGSGSARMTKTISSPTAKTKVRFDVTKLDWGAYEVEASFGDLVTSKATATVLPGGKHRVRVLNNFASELMDTKARDLNGQSEIAFMNPRTGWIYIEAPGGAVRLNDETAALTTPQAMRHLPLGRHTLHIGTQPDNLIVRSVPYLVYSTDPVRYKPTVMDEIFRNANVILTGGRGADLTESWAELGKHRMAFEVAPSHGVGGDKFFDADAYTARMRRHLGFTRAGYQGAMADQISSASPQQKMHIAMTMARLAADPKLKGRGWCAWHEGQPAGSSADRALMRITLDEGWPYSFYRYLSEPKTEAQMDDMVRDQIIQGMIACKGEYPEAIKKLVMTLGYMSHPPRGINQNTRPDRNFRVLMERQMHAMATHPEVFGVYGALWYYSPYVDKENAKWAARLFRHYGIEGKTTMLSNDPYVLTHLVNPDFADGAAGWTLSEANPGAGGIRTEHLKGYGHLQGRYLGGNLGDKMLVTRRSSKAPNRFSQTIRDLVPGRVYSLKMISADYQNITNTVSEERLDAVNVKIDNVDLVPGDDQNKQWAWSHRLNGLGFDEKNKKLAWLNFHWYVFKAKGETATLTVSDWVDDNKPGGEIGREVIFNFIEVQPYLD